VFAVVPQLWILASGTLGSASAQGHGVTYVRLCQKLLIHVIGL